jgi:hypothetical protein
MLTCQTVWTGLTEMFKRTPDSAVLNKQTNYSPKRVLNDPFKYAEAYTSGNDFIYTLKGLYSTGTFYITTA